MQTEVALMYDATRVILETFNRLLKKKPDIFRNNFRRGEVYNNGTKGINCTQTPVMPWEHGDRITRFMKKVKYILQKFRYSLYKHKLFENSYSLTLFLIN